MDKVEEKNNKLTVCVCVSGRVGCVSLLADRGNEE